MRGTLAGMTDTMTLTGLVATTPRHLVTSEGLPVTSFRLASSQRRFDRKQNAWVDAGTNWYTVSTYRQLATNLVGSVQKGDRVLVTGRLRIQDWESGDKKGTNIEVVADTLGHDLFWGKAVFTRTIQAASASFIPSAESGPEVGPEAEQGTGPGAGIDAEGAAYSETEPEREDVPVPF